MNRPYPIAIHDVSYASVDGGRVPGYLVDPARQGSLPCGSLPARLGRRPPGAARAGGLDGCPRRSRAHRRRPLRARPAASRRKRRRRDPEVPRQLRAGASRPGARGRPAPVAPYVDGSRIAFVGFSGGARMGAILAGSEPRIRAFDLVSGGGLPAAAFVDAAPVALRKQVAKAFEGLDGLAEIRRSHARFLFQDGLCDAFVPRAQLTALAAAAPRPKELRWYETGHVPGKRALREQLAWLSRELGLGAPVVPGAVTGP